MTDLDRTPSELMTDAEWDRVADRASERRQALRDEAEPEFEFRCPQCLGPSDDGGTCDAPECQAWLAGDLASDEPDFRESVAPI